LEAFDSVLLAQVGQLDQLLKLCCADCLSLALRRQFVEADLLGRLKAGAVDLEQQGGFILAQSRRLATCAKRIHPFRERGKLIGREALNGLEQLLG
jgi:hypothetical protein